MMAETTDLESLTLDTLVDQYQQVIDELVALDRVPAQPDDAEHWARLNRLYERAGEFSMEINRRARYAAPPETAAPDALVLDDRRTTITVVGGAAGVLVTLEDAERSGALALSIDEAADLVARLERGIEQAHAAKRETALELAT